MHLPLQHPNWVQRDFGCHRYVPEDEDMKVSEFINIDTDFEYGIGLEVAVNAEVITLEDINRFVRILMRGPLS